MTSAPTPHEIHRRPEHPAACQVRNPSKRLNHSRLRNGNTWHQKKSEVVTGLANVMRHEMPDSCRLNSSPREAMARDNSLMDNKMSRSRVHRPFNVRRQSSVAFAPRYSDA
jgi:hypothetical protein